MSKKRLRWMLGIALAFVVAAPFTPWQALAQKAVSKHEPRVILRVTYNPTKMIRDDAPVSASEYHLFRQTLAGYLSSAMVLGSALREPKIIELTHLKLDIDQLREKLVVEIPPDSEFLNVSIRDMPAMDSKVVLNVVIQTFLRNVVEQTRRDKLDRLEKLRKLWDAYQITLKAKRQSIREVMVAFEKHEIRDLERKIAGQRMESDSLELDKLELSKVGLATKLERLKALKRVDEEDRKTLRRSEDESAVVEAQMNLLKKRIEAATDLLGKPKTSPRPIDLTQEQDELELAMETARKVGKEIESIEVELLANDTVQIVDIRD